MQSKASAFLQLFCFIFLLLNQNYNWISVQINTWVSLKVNQNQPEELSSKPQCFLLTQANGPTAFADLWLNYMPELHGHTTNTLWLCTPFFAAACNHFAMVKYEQKISSRGLKIQFSDFPIPEFNLQSLSWDYIASLIILKPDENLPVLPTNTDNLKQGIQNCA